MFSPFSERYAPSSSTAIPSTPAAPLFLTTYRYAALRLSLLNICSMRLLVSMRCFLSAPFAFAAFEAIDRRYSPATEWNVLQLSDCSARIYPYFQQLLDFSAFCHLIRISEPYMWFLSVRSEVCLQLLSDSVSRRTPLLFSYVLHCCLRTLGTCTR